MPVTVSAEPRPSLILVRGEMTIKVYGAYEITLPDGVKITATVRENYNPVLVDPDRITTTPVTEP